MPKHLMIKKGRSRRRHVTNNINKKNTYINNIFLEKITESLPQYIFWKDVNSVYLGCNKNYADFVGLSSPKEIVGKTDYDLHWQASGHTAEDFQKGDKETLSGKPITNQEETLVLPNGKTLITLVSKLPIIDNGKAIGIVGYFTDITKMRKTEAQAKSALKERARLRLENVSHQIQLQEQKKFAKKAHQVAHDIRSPLASLLMIVKSCTAMPEMDRIVLREAANSINHIANSLLSRYKTKESEATITKEECEPILISATLLQLLTDKKLEYYDLPIKFKHEFNQGSHFAFVQMELNSFKRMLSNLINNAVDALEKKEGKIILKLNALPQWVDIVIQDNGKGMLPEVREKILKNIEVTEGKVKGHGIGLTQVRETLQRNHGELFIDSKVGQGTQIRLRFPRIQAPNWIVEEIQLNSEDRVVILDDDASIHMAWDVNFSSILKQFPAIQVKHFEHCKEALCYIDALKPQEKKKVFLLTDFELLEQELNGSHVIENSGIKRSILVTSHYGNAIVRERAATVGTRILPKQLASEIPIHIHEKKHKESLGVVDLILVDDDERFAKTLMTFIFGDNTVDYFKNPKEFKENLSKYPKDTRIYLDNAFALGIKGIDIAKELHEQGFSRLYLLSGEVFRPNQLPSYLTVILKSDVDKIKNW